MSDDLPPLRAALEAVLLVVDEPVAEVTLAQVVERPTEEVGRVLRELAADYDESGRGFSCARSPAGGGCTPGRSAPRSSSGSCATVSRPG